MTFTNNFKLESYDNSIKNAYLNAKDKIACCTSDFTKFDMNAFSKVEDRPATEEDIADVQQQLAQSFNDPNYELVNFGHCFNYSDVAPSVAPYGWDANPCANYFENGKMTYYSTGNTQVALGPVEYVGKFPERVDIPCLPSIDEINAIPTDILTVTQGAQYVDLGDAYVNWEIAGTQGTMAPPSYIPPMNAPRPNNHIGFGPKQVTARHVHNAYVPAAQSVVQQLISGTFVPSGQPVKPARLRSFEGTVFGRVEVQE